MLLFIMSKIFLHNIHYLLQASFDKASRQMRQILSNESIPVNLPPPPPPPPHTSVGGLEAGLGLEIDSPWPRSWPWLWKVVTLTRPRTRRVVTRVETGPRPQNIVQSTYFTCTSVLS